MSAPTPLVVHTTLAGPNGTATTVSGSWKRILFENFDATNAIGFKINGSAEASRPPLTNYGDTYERGIDSVTLINRGGTPEYQLILHP